MKRLLAFVLVYILLPTSAFADETRVVPSISLAEAYNSNITFATSNILSDYVTTISPGLELVKNTERLELSAKARGDQLIYETKSDYNSFDQFYNGAAKFRASQIWNLSADAAFSRSSQPDTDILTTGLVLGRATRNHVHYGGSTDYLMTEKLQTQLSYSYDSDVYSDPRYSNLYTNTANLGFLYDIDQYLRTAKVRTNFGYAHYDSTGVSLDNYIGTLGLMWNFHETWSFVIDVGARYTSSDFDVQTLQFVPPASFQTVTLQQSSAGWGGVGQATLTYRGEKGKIDLSYVRDVMPASGYTGATERNALTLALSHRITYELSGTLSASYFTNNSTQGQFSATPIDQTTYTLAPGLRYEFTRDMVAEASYSYTRVDYNVYPKTTADRSLAMIRFIAQCRFLE